jgi:hypothetical protein
MRATPSFSMASKVERAFLDRCEWGEDGKS